MVALSREHLEDCALPLVDLKGKTRDLVVVVVGATRARGEGGERCRVGQLIEVNVIYLLSKIIESCVEKNE